MFRPCNQGLTLLELLIAMTIMVMLAGTLGALANGIQQTYEYTEGHSTATQHARVVLDRIARTVREAVANDQFPGAIVVAEEVGPWRFPDTLVVWRPTGDPVDPDGLPRYNELVIYCPNWYTPNRLAEITVPDDTRTVPPVEDESQWATEIEAIKRAWLGDTVTLTHLMRSCAVTESSTTSWRGAVRFETRLQPSQEQWNDYKDGGIDWDDLSWVQGIYGSQTGLRQVWVRIELQLMPGDAAVASDPDTQQPICFFGSAALYYEMHR